MKSEAQITYEYEDSLYINLTNKCPCRCDFCLRQNSDGSLYSDNLWYHGPEPTKEEILMDLQCRDLLSYKEIVFCGYGEPACRWNDMMWLCDRLKEIGPYFIRLNTNGLSDLINKRSTAQEMIGRVDAVSVSLNASTPEKYDAICHSIYGLKALPAIIRFTSVAVLNVPHVRMTVVSTMDKEEITACRSICQSIGADFHIREYIST